MSVINQTLRALDARKPQSAPPGVPLRPVARGLRRSPVLWAGGTAVLSIAVLGAWLVSRPAESTLPAQADSPSRARPHAAAPTPASSVPPVLVPAAVAAQAPASVPPVSPAASSVKPKGPQNQPAPDRSTPPFSLSQATGLPDPVDGPPAIRKDIVKPSVDEEAEERYRKAIALMQKGRESQARPYLEDALKLSPGHVAARQTLAALLSEAGQNLDAESVLREGRAQAPDNAWYALSLARLQAARGDADGAAATLLSGVEGRGVNAEYRATLAALLMRLKQHPEAARHYTHALEQQPDQGTWWMGLGLALEAQGKAEEARSAFRRALTTGNLPDRLQEFVRSKSTE